MGSSPTSTSTDEFLAQRYFPSLDGLRGVSILPVVWHHSTPYPYPGVLGKGPIGVDLFFAISGFLITTLLVREQNSHGTIDLSAFYARRACRIFPLYYLVFVLHVLYAAWFCPSSQPCRLFLANSGYFATYTANWVLIGGPTLFAFAWSLCTEEQFYAFWAPILRVTQRASRAAWVMGLWLLLDAWWELFPPAFLAALPALMVRVVRSFASPIGFGALLAIAAHHPRWGRVLASALGRQWSAPLTGIAVVGLIVWPVAPPIVLHLGLALLVACCALRRANGLSWWLQRSSLGFIGRVSYGIYLWHVAVIGGIVLVRPSIREQPLLLFGLAFPISCLVAGLSYRYFERPFLSLGARYRRN